MIERSLWHPVAGVDDVSVAPLAVQLLGQPLVLWRDGTGALRAFADRCPHRGARLSLGCVRGGQLECPYHGWRFEGDGRVAAVPALPAFVPPPSHRATAYAVREHCGLLWLRLDDDAAAGDAGPPAFAAEHDTRLRKLNCGPYEVATSAPRIVENFLDMAHFAFVHEGWLGDRAHTEVQDHRIDATPHGFVATGCRAWQPRSSARADGGVVVEYRYEVNAPYTAVLCKVPAAGSGVTPAFEEAIALFVCPLTPESSRVWFRLALTDFDTPDADLRAFQHAIFSQDQPVLESQVPKRLPISAEAPVLELHSAADRSSSAYRRYLLQRGIGHGVC